MEKNGGIPGAPYLIYIALRLFSDILPGKQGNLLYVLLPVRLLLVGPQGVGAIHNFLYFLFRESFLVPLQLFMEGIVLPGGKPPHRGY